MGKKILLVLIAVLTLTTIVACAQPAPAPTPSPAPAPSPAPLPPPTPSPTPTPAPSPAPAPAPAPTPSPTGPLRVLMGASGTASSNYIFAVEWAKIMNKYLAGELEVTVVETASTIENEERMRTNEFALNIYGNPDAAYQSLHGIGAWAGKPAGPLRDLFMWSWQPCYFFVRADSGVTKLEDLAGKAIATGPPGSLTLDYAVKTMDALGIKIDSRPASFADGAAMMKDRRVIGAVKAFPTNVVDSMALDIMSTSPIRLLPFTEAQVATVQKKYPFIPWASVPAGWWPEFKDVPAHKTFLFPAVAGAHATMISQALGFKITDVALAHYKEMNWSAFKILDPAKGMFDVLYGMAEPPWLHAGAAQYYKAKGYDVKASVIPPEYKP